MDKKLRGLARKVYSNYKSNCRQRLGHCPFEISFEEFCALIERDCYICGKRPSNRARWPRGQLVLFYSGLDRIDNSLGYVQGNVMPCCHRCNSIKSEMSLDDLKEHLEEMLRGMP